MKKNWFLQMEQITIFMGAAIVLLGFLNILGEANISGAFVTGISLAGLFLTLSDFLNKLIGNGNDPVLEKKVIKIGAILYYIAAFCIIAFPNSKLIVSLPKESLDSMSTSASVIALGVVFMMIGDNNRRAVASEQKKQNELLDYFENELRRSMDENSKKVDELKEVLKEKDTTIKNLEQSIKESQRNKIEV
ncbi:hypothetical protein [Bacillus sp. PM5]|uniref:hypothetical protein n=1 Tax=Bacillus sp. PM5 TaxID=3414495 RepID=UPI003DA8C221